MKRKLNTTSSTHISMLSMLGTFTFPLQRSMELMSTFNSKKGMVSAKTRK